MIDFRRVNENIDKIRKRVSLRACFTLAEVLITLGIIGIVAAMTLPTLVQKYQEQESVSKLKETYSILSSAYAMAVMEHGLSDTWPVEGLSNNERSKLVYDYMAPYLKIPQDIEVVSSVANGVAKGLPSPWNYINNNGKYECYRQDASPYWVYLANGTLVAFKSSNKVINGLIVSDESLISVNVDVNGAKKPNVIGKDFFMFYLYKKKNSPALTYSKNIRLCDKDSSDSGSFRGIACAYWILSRGNMDYLHRDVSFEW